MQLDILYVVSNDKNVQFEGTNNEIVLLGQDVFIEPNFELNPSMPIVIENSIYSKYKDRIKALRLQNIFLLFEQHESVQVEECDSQNILGVLTKPLGEKDLLNIKLSNQRIRRNQETNPHSLFNEISKEVFVDEIINNNSVWISLRNKDGDYIVWNTAAERITGYSSDEVLGHQKILEYLHEDKVYCSEIESKIKHAIANNIDEGFEISISHKNGDKKDINLYTKGIFDVNNKFIGNLSIAYDVSSKKLAEAQRLLDKEKEITAKIINLNPYPIMILDPQGKYVTSNISFEKIVKGNKPVSGHSFYDDPALIEAGIIGQVKDVLKGKPVITDNYWYDFNLLRGTGIDVDKIISSLGRDKVCLKTVMFPIVDSHTLEVESVVVMQQDVTQQTIAKEQLKSSLEKKELLLKEINHRIKNNLQIVSSLLNLQASSIDDEKAVMLFDEAQNRLKSMALIHENLYESEDFENIDLSKYIKKLALNLFEAYKSYEAKIKLKTSLEEVFVDVQKAVSIGLIVNEVISNSLKYAFVEKSNGLIVIELEKQKETDLIALRMKDNGCGMKGEVDIDNPATLGLQLIFSLSQQLQAEIKCNLDIGVAYEIGIPS